MSTNNNRLGKEVQPEWKDDDSKSCQIKKFSADKLARLTLTGTVENVTALSLSGRGIGSIDETSGLSKLRRLDLSKNKLKRLAHMANLSSLGMLNLSSNELSGGESLEELRYLPELRTLNIGENPSLGRIKKHTMRSLPNLQAFIAHDCGLNSTEFLRKSSPLTTIILSKNSLDDFPSLHPDGSFYNLVKLNISHNKFTTFPDLSFCPSMEELKINNNMLGSIPSTLLENKKLKTLSVASNQISSWASIELLTGLPLLTNLSTKGNPLPDPPAENSDFVLREDLSAEKLSFSDAELKYRRHLLGLFQISVGKELKLKVRLIVLDMHRVKAKWSHEVVEASTGTNNRASKSSKKSLSATSSMSKANSVVEGGSSTNDVKKTRKKRPRSDDADKIRSRNHASVETEEMEPDAPSANELAAGEVLGAKRRRGASSTTADTANKERMQMESINAPVRAATSETSETPVTPSGEIMEFVKQNRGAESGVVSVSMKNKKKPSAALDAPVDAKKSNKKGKSKATQADVVKRSVEDVLFGGADGGSAAITELSGWD